MEKDELILKFLNYRIERMNYETNENFKEEEKADIFPLISYNIVKSPIEDNKFNIILGIKYKEKNNLPFTLEVSLRGYFQVSSNLREENKIKALIVNGSAIIFPYIRSLVTDLTSRSNFRPIILPTMNFSQMVEEYSKNTNSSFLLPNKFYEEYKG